MTAPIEGGSTYDGTESLGGSPASRPRADFASHGTGGFVPDASFASRDDLSRDKILLAAPRIDVNGEALPSLGGIPLVGKIGQGGMGAVYYGYHPRMQREVAVKVLPFLLAESRPHMVDRFFREAQLAGTVQSDHLVHAMDVNQESGLFYIVMEYVRGISAGEYLKEVLNAGRTGLGEREALDIVCAATTGLAAAHAQGVIHRDVKPDNILLPRASPSDPLNFGAAKLADLGLARGENPGPAITDSLDVIGTPGYLSPEQAVNAKTVGKPADVFGMGATLYALLAGQPPFTGESVVQTVFAAVNKAHKPITDLRPDIQSPVAWLLDRCLQKDPTRRFPDGPALLRALEICRDSLGQPTAAQQQAIAHMSELLTRPEEGQAVIVADAELDSAVIGASQAGSPPLPRRGGRTIAIAATIFILVAGGIFGAQAWSRAQRMEALSVALPAASAAKTNGEWPQVIAALDAPLRGIGDDEHPHRALAENMLNEAREILAKRTEFAEKLTAAQTLMTGKEWAAATASFDAAIRACPDAPDVATARAGIAVARVELSTQRFQNALDAARAAMTGKHWAEAEAAFTDALRERPDNPEALAGRTQARYELAMQSANSALNGQAPNSSGLYENVPGDKRREAESSLWLAVELKPADAPAHTLLTRLGYPKEKTLDFGGGVELRLVLVTPGEFEMGANYPEESLDNEKFAHRVRITQPYYIGKHHVTVAQFGNFADATKYRTEAEIAGMSNGLIPAERDWRFDIKGFNWRTPGFPQDGRHPVVHVSHNDASAFVKWLSQKAGAPVRLPTEAEFEYAARGAKGFKYPWGNMWEGRRTNHADAGLRDSRTTPPGWVFASQINDGHLYTAPAGVFDNASWCGALDMTGNVGCWCQDWYQPFYYKDSPLTDPQGPPSGTGRVLRGAGWSNEPLLHRATFRNQRSPKYATATIGFRVAMPARQGTEK